MALANTDANIYKSINNRWNIKQLLQVLGTIASGALGNKEWVGLAYGAGKWIALAKDGNTVISQQMTEQLGLTGAAVTPSPEVYNDLVFGNNCWVATMAQSIDRIIYSDNGTTWYDAQTC